VFCIDNNRLDADRVFYLYLYALYIFRKENLYYPIFISDSLYAWFSRKSTTHIMLTLLKKFAEDYTEIFLNSLFPSNDFTMPGNEVFNGEF
jgi:hypothetical protein